MDLKKLILDYMNEAKLMQVVTSKSRQPWACSVYFAFDNKLNLYWISTPTRRHSIEIRDNDKVAGTIVLPHIPGDKVRGIQFEGRAEELTNKELARVAMSHYAKRYNLDRERVKAILENRDGHLPYKITPRLIVLFDEVNFPKNSRQEFKLS
jgi:uncharacterized protein YhbP (UPF0306 family)